MFLVVAVAGVEARERSGVRRRRCRCGGVEIGTEAAREDGEARPGALQRHGVRSEACNCDSAKAPSSRLKDFWTLVPEILDYITFLSMYL